MKDVKIREMMDDLNNKIERGNKLFREDGHEDDIQMELDARIDAMFDLHKGPQRKKPRKSMWIILALLLLMVLAGLYFLNQKANTQVKTPEEIFAAYYEPFPNIISGQVRGEASESGDMNEDLLKAMSNYEQGDYQSALDYLEKLPDDATLLIYKGVSLLELGQVDAAIKIFEESNMMKDQGVYDAVLWYQALALIKGGQNEQAVVKLQEIVLLENHYKANEAARLLDQIQ